MDCTVFDWETAADPIADRLPAEKRSLLERRLKRAYPVIVDDDFLDMLRALGELPANS